jgi:predicted dehydrogenase
MEPSGHSIEAQLERTLLSWNRVSLAVAANGGLTVRRTTFTIAETGESKPMTADDQVGVTGLLEGGAAFSIHYRGGHARGTNLLWEINGTEGDLQLTAAGGQAQIFELDVRGGKGAQASLEILPVPEEYRWSPPQVPGPSHQRPPSVRAFRS